MPLISRAISLFLALVLILVLIRHPEVIATAVEQVMDAARRAADALAGIAK